MALKTGVSGYLPPYFNTAYVPSQYNNGVYVEPHYVEEYHPEENYSVIKIDYINVTSSYYEQWVTWTVAGTININGTDYGYSGTCKTANWTATQMPCSIVSNPIYHNSDGTKTITITHNKNYVVSGQVGMDFGENTGTLGQKTVTLTTIPRASGVSATNANITEQSTIVITRYSNSFTHELTWTFGNLYGTIVSNTSDTTIYWTLPESLYTQIPNATSGVGTITCSTFYNGNVIGTNSCQFRATAKVDLAKPTLNPTVKDISPETLFLTGDENTLIKYHSDVEINIGASARCSATLTAVNCACGGKSIGTMTGTINDVETGLFTFSATDSRGYTTTTGISKNFIDYVKITSNIEVPNPTTHGETILTITGNYYNGSFGKENNILVVLYRMKENDSSYGDWQTATATINKNNTYKAVVNITGLNYLNSYTFQARAYDMLATVDSVEKKVKTIPIFDWGENDFNFNVPVVFSAGYTVAETSLVSDAYDANSLMSYKLMGVINAMSNSYQMKATYTKGANYTEVTGNNAILIGNSLRCYFNATRSSATGAGNIANETVCNIKIHHGGKIKDALNISVPNGATGGLAGFTTTNLTVDDTYITFDVSLSAVDVASTQFSTYFTIPVLINLDAFV